MRILVIGAVAAGTSAAAKARRNDDLADIVIYERDIDISYSACGLPYYIGGAIESIEELVPRDTKFFKEKYNIDILTGHEVKRIDPIAKEITVENRLSGKIFTDTYDKLIIATGATSFMPNIKGLNERNVFCLRNIQSAKRIKDFIEVKKPKNAIVVGTGFIGFEMLENLIAENIKVTIIEKEDSITPHLDEDMAVFLESTLRRKGIAVFKGRSIDCVQEDKVILEDGTALESDMVIMATGVKPNITLAKDAGIEIGITGAIKVNTKMQTSSVDVYACGDCVETFSRITGQPVYKPLGSIANKTGRIAGDVVTGGRLEYKGNLGTGIFKIFDLVVASTGLTEEEARQAGYEVVICHNIKLDKPHYFKGKEMLIKAVADKATDKLLGVQIIGYKGVDKRIDVFATLITYGATVDELFHLDLAYAPPFSTTKDPVHYTGIILENMLHHERPLKTASEVKELKE